MQQLNLNTRKGMPMYFIKERQKGLDYKINFSDVNKAEVGDELELEFFIYKIKEINEFRLSPLEYPTDKDVFFHSTISTLVRRIETINNQRVEKPYEEPVPTK